MPFTIQTTGENIALELDGGVTARDVSEIAAGLLAALRANTTVSVRAAGLDDIDTSVLQLLVSLQKTVTGFTIPSHSSAFVNAVDRCSLRRELLPAEAA